ncbi:ribosomal RNA small subunit methyltransferase A [Patescibacteria group bacterium]|nr:ribosomal RNA small subunit methyltransferase A [Patescibacteria group bacterium]MBU2264139.1 ribosomal RNA small subunit methyltransferase A [Patescibacteria group bacterium]
MDLSQQTKHLCNLYEIKPARSKGQNFLIKEEIYDKIIATADLKSDDVVLEVGPGLGFLTAKLAARVKKVIAVELDDKLAKILRAGLIAQGIKNVEVVNKSILDIKIQPPLPPLIKGVIQPPLLPLSGQRNKIVANLPFNITSIFLRKFLSAEIKPELMVLMLQKQVAERIVAKPGKMSLLAVSVQFYAKPDIEQIVLKENFWPRSEVDSAIVKITLRQPKNREKDFFQLVKFGFSAKRKMLKNNLAAGLKISQNQAVNKITNAGFNPKIRAQELSVDDWFKLLREFY